jgi:hypothetical protein
VPGWSRREDEPPAWLDAGDVGRIAQVGHRALAFAYRQARTQWSSASGHDGGARTPEPWLESVRPVVSRWLERQRQLPHRAITLSPTGPTEGDPLLCVVVDDWSPEQWLDWLGDRSAEAPLALPFRAHKRPLVLAPDVLRSDVYIEHAALFHAARAAGSLDLSGTAPEGCAPPADVLQRAAVRETLHALVRIPLDAARARTERGLSLNDATEPRSVADAFRFRVRAYVAARLPALSLLLDHGTLLGTRRAVVEAYLRSYDDELAALLDAPATSLQGGRIAGVLEAWAQARMGKLRELMPPVP